jgi:hypothetical protein
MQWVWRELFIRTSSEEGSGSKQLAPQLLLRYFFKHQMPYAI